MPFLYSQTGVYRGIHFFLFLLQNIDVGTRKKRLNEAVLNWSTIYVLSKSKKNIKNFRFYSREKLLYIT